MKIIILCLTLLLCSLDTTATISPTHEPDTKLTAVTVYTSGAMITREIDTGDKLGIQELIIKGLPSTIENKSVTIKGNNNVEILSLNCSVEQKVQSDALEMLYTQDLKSINDSLKLTAKLMEVLKIELSMIRANEKYGDSSGKTEINNVVEASNFYRKRIKEILLEQYTLENKISDLTKRRNSFSLLQQESKTEQTQNETQIKIKINANSKGEKIELNYYIANARWYPFYDVKVDGLDQKLKLFRKAYVSQHTGEDWDDVNLILSNASPQENAVLPPLQPYFLDGRRNGNTYNQPQQFNNNRHSAYGVVIDERTGEPIIAASIFIKELNTGTTTDFSGRFGININREVIAEISYVGYATKQCILKPGNNTFYIGEGAMMEEVVITGSRSKSSFYYIDGIKVNAKNAKNMVPRAEIKQTKISAISSVEYHVETPYSIKSDGKEIDVLLEVDEIDAEYTYHATPSLSEKAYLIAKIPDWYKLGLLTGKANLFLSNTYKGVTHIYGNSTEDTLNISLGVDPEVIIDREQIKDLYTKKVLSKNVEELIVYETKIRNNKTVDIQLTLMDQIPLSNNKDIKISVEDTSQAKLEEDTGILSWAIGLSPGEEEVKSLKYKVKYPKKYKMIN